MAEACCRYCWRPASIGGHNEGCPEELGTDEAMQEWQRGYVRGMRDDLISWHEARYYTKTYILGNRAGSAELEEQIGLIMDAR